MNIKRDLCIRKKLRSSPNKFNWFRQFIILFPTTANNAFTNFDCQIYPFFITPLQLFHHILNFHREKDDIEETENSHLRYHELSHIHSNCSSKYVYQWFVVLMIKMCSFYHFMKIHFLCRSLFRFTPISAHVSRIVSVWHDEECDDELIKKFSINIAMRSRMSRNMIASQKWVYWVWAMSIGRSRCIARKF